MELLNIEFDNASADIRNSVFFNILLMTTLVQKIDPVGNPGIYSSMRLLYKDTISLYSSLWYMHAMTQKS